MNTAPKLTPALCLHQTIIVSALLLSAVNAYGFSSTPACWIGEFHIDPTSCENLNYNRRFTSTGYNRTALLLPMSPSVYDDFLLWGLQSAYGEAELTVADGSYNPYAIIVQGTFMCVTVTTDQITVSCSAGHLVEYFRASQPFDGDYVPITLYNSLPCDPCCYVGFGYLFNGCGGYVTVTPYSLDDVALMKVPGGTDWTDVDNPDIPVRNFTNYSQYFKKPDSSLYCLKKFVEGVPEKEEGWLGRPAEPNSALWGDYNSDGTVDLEDFAIMANGWAGDFNNVFFEAYMR